MLLPWAINGIPEDSETPAVAAPTMVQQPLADLGGGETIREIRASCRARIQVGRSNSHISKTLACLSTLTLCKGA